MKKNEILNNKSYIKIFFFFIINKYIINLHMLYVYI